jgi:hypothetical protein
MKSNYQRQSKKAESPKPLETSRVGRFYECDDENIPVLENDVLQIGRPAYV